MKNVLKIAEFLREFCTISSLDEIASARFANLPKARRLLHFHRSDKERGIMSSEHHHVDIRKVVANEETRRLPFLNISG